MIELLSIVEHAALGEIIKRVITGAVDWAKGRKKPAPAAVDKKLVELADKNLSASIPPEDRQAAIESVVDLAKPTFEEIVRYSRNVQEVMLAAKRAPGKKSAPTWHAHRAPVKKAVAKKASAKKAAAKKAPAKKVAMKKAPMRRF